MAVSDRESHLLPVPIILDQTADAHPKKIAYSVAKTVDPKDGFRDINFRELAAAVNRAAWWLDAKFGKSDNFETLAYLAPGDLRYAILTIAASKVGYKVNNSLAFLYCVAWLILSFLATALITPQQPRGSVVSLERNRMFQVPMWSIDCGEGKINFGRLLKCRVGHSARVGRFNERGISATICVQNRRCILRAIHGIAFFRVNRSVSLKLFYSIDLMGCLGVPKPIILRHGYFMAWGHHCLIPPVNGQPLNTWPLLKGPLRLYMAMPFFHVSGSVLSRLQGNSGTNS
jgi:hypothetical protein